MDRVFDLVTVLSAALIAMILASVRRSHIRVEYSVSWLVGAVILLVLSRAQTSLQWTAEVLGIRDPPLALLLVCFCVFAVVFYRSSVVLSELKDSHIALAQRVAILQYRLQSLHDEGEASSAS
jgi:hypothetical protein